MTDPAGTDVVALRPVEDGDLDALFEQMRDPVAVHMAAFTADDPDDRAAFDAHQQRLRHAPGIRHRAIVRDGRIVGSAGAFPGDEGIEVTYWVDRAVWGQGVAGRALALLLGEVRERPVWARVAADNAGSLAVLRRAGFTPVRTERGWANARGEEIDELVLRLD